MPVEKSGDVIRDIKEQKEILDIKPALIQSQAEKPSTRERAAGTLGTSEARRELSIAYIYYSLNNEGTFPPADPHKAWTEMIKKNQDYIADKKNLSLAVGIKREYDDLSWKTRVNPLNLFYALGEEGRKDADAGEGESRGLQLLRDLGDDRRAEIGGMVDSVRDRVKRELVERFGEWDAGKGQVLPEVMLEEYTAVELLSRLRQAAKNAGRRTLDYVCQTFGLEEDQVKARSWDVLKNSGWIGWTRSGIVNRINVAREKKQGIAPTKEEKDYASAEPLKAGYAKLASGLGVGVSLEEFNVPKAPEVIRNLMAADNEKIGGLVREDPKHWLRILSERLKKGEKIS